MKIVHCFRGGRGRHTFPANVFFFFLPQAEQWLCDHSYSDKELIFHHRKGAVHPKKRPVATAAKEHKEQWWRAGKLPCITSRSNWLLLVLTDVSSVDVTHLSCMQMSYTAAAWCCRWAPPPPFMYALLSSDEFWPGSWFLGIYVRRGERLPGWMLDESKTQITLHIIQNELTCPLTAAVYGFRMAPKPAEYSSVEKQKKHVRHRLVFFKTDRVRGWTLLWNIFTFQYDSSNIKTSLWNKTYMA